MRGGLAITGELNKSEALMVWMRTATLPNFRKLWGILDMDLKAGDEIQVDVLNRYNTYQFDGTKSFVLSTTTWIGGKNPAIGIVALVTGSAAVLAAFAFLAAVKVQTRKVGDLSYLSWNRE